MTDESAVEKIEGIDHGTQQQGDLVHANGALVEGTGTQVLVADESATNTPDVTGEVLANAGSEATAETDNSWNKSGAAVYAEGTNKMDVIIVGVATNAQHVELRRVKDLDSGEVFEVRADQLAPPGGELSDKYDEIQQTELKAGKYYLVTQTGKKEIVTVSGSGFDMNKNRGYAITENGSVPIDELLVFKDSAEVVPDDTSELTPAEGIPSDVTQKDLEKAA